MNIEALNVSKARQGAGRKGGLAKAAKHPPKASKRTARELSTSAQNWVKDANGEHERRMDSEEFIDEPLPGLTVSPWEYRFFGNDEDGAAQEAVYFAGFPVWSAEENCRFSVRQAKEDAADIARCLSCWIDSEATT